MNRSTSDLEQALAALNLKSAPGLWWESWMKSQTAFDPGKLFFLNPEFVNDTGRMLGMSAEVRGALLQALSLFDRHPELKRLAWHCHYLLFQTPGNNARIHEWPGIPPKPDEATALFYAFVMFSGIPALLKMHRDRGIPKSITLDTLSDIELWIKEHRNWYGILGLDQIDWLINHLTGRLIKLGRLQFCFESWAYDFHAFRHRQTRRVLLLAGNNLPFRKDGQFNDADGITGATPGWVSVFDAAGSSVIQGHPVTPEGCVLPHAVELYRNDWEEILRKSDPALGVHIPAIGPLSHEACGDSFRQACRFFPAHFPDRPWRAFTCGSWLLDPQFERRLPESSNIVRALREMYLHPIPGANSSQTFQRAFGKSFENLPIERIDEAPRTTSLQRVLVQHVKSGGRWRTGGSVLFPEDMDWGMQVYRSIRRPDIPSLSAYPKG